MAALEWLGAGGSAQAGAQTVSGAGSLVQTPAEEATRRNLLLWAWITAVAALVFEVDDQLPRVLGDIGVFAWWPDHRVAVHFVLAVCGGAALCLFGRPAPKRG